MSKLIQTIGQTLASRATAESVFGAPIVVGPRTYVPVARIQFGYGGGEHEGAGGGLEATPLGLLELTEEGATFLPLSEPSGWLETAPGIFTLAPHSWLLRHEGRVALVNPPPPGAWLSHLNGPVDLIIGHRETPLFPEARRLSSGPALWQGQLGGEPLFVLPGDEGVIFRGVWLLFEGGSAGSLHLPGDYRVHSQLPR
ncbi:MAG: hypothetical protein KF760_33645 [Candidatus Eremiobacteraeota bacterium]|nr:hypothetical protein [Candidatus Eremiobacteraeota bacterium]MCW5869847.1 hypothetical protein [Candidatus Eremiobacteraeota bacterium]